YVKIRVLSAHKPSGVFFYTTLGKIKILEAERAGYVPLLARSPDIRAVRSVDASAAAESPAVHPATDPSGAVALGTSADVACRKDAPATNSVAPAHQESRSVLAVLRADDLTYPPLRYQAGKLGDRAEFSIYNRVTFTRVMPEAATPLLLVP